MLGIYKVIFTFELDLVDHNFHNVLIKGHIRSAGQTMALITLAFFPIKKHNRCQFAISVIEQTVSQS